MHRWKNSTPSSLKLVQPLIKKFQKSLCHLDKIYRWQREKNMIFNGKYFEMLQYEKKTYLKINTKKKSPDYQDLIEVKDNFRDLQIIMSDDASFNNTIHKVWTTVKQKCGWVLRTFQNRETHFMKCMWKTLIQGHISYYHVEVTADLSFGTLFTS